MNNNELSYQAHINNWNSRTSERDERLFHLINKNCINYQLQKRTLDVLKPFVKSKSSWLTVGDYNGLEANYLLNQGQDAVASDISDYFLIEAQKEHLINEYSQVNVEKIHYNDNSFDYLFCKEAFHHFPKAYLGLYEMIRCSRKATIMIEPIDVLSKMPLLLFVKNVLDLFNPNLINKLWKNRFSFETVGNYVFKISEREIEKIAMGMGLTCIAFKRINLILDLKADKTIINQAPINQSNWKKILKRIRVLNFLSATHLIPYNHLYCVMFKEKPDATVIESMKSLDYVILDLPENPYLK